MIAETNKFENKYLSPKERKGKNTAQTTLPLCSRFCSLKKQNVEKKKKSLYLRRLHDIARRIFSQRFLKPPIPAYHRCLHAIMPDSLVFDISHVLCDRYTARRVPIRYLQKARGINRNRPNAGASVGGNIRFLFFPFLHHLHLTSLCLSFSPSYSPRSSRTCS